MKSKYVDKFVCFSRRECEYYSSLFGVALEKFVYVPLGIESSEIETSKGDYIFSTGRSNRDYDFLVDALKGRKEKTIIACDSYQGQEEGNVKVDRNCYGEKMRRVMAGSFCVVVPLKNPRISAGQLVILQAMEMGKPVIVTESDGVSDYVQNGKTGFIVNKSSAELIEAIDRLRAEKQLYESISLYSHQYFSQHHTESAMGRAVGEVLMNETSSI